MMNFSISNYTAHQSTLAAEDWIKNEKMAFSRLGQIVDFRNISPIVNREKRQAMNCRISIRDTIFEGPRTSSFPIVGILAKVITDIPHDYSSPNSETHKYDLYCYMHLFSNLASLINIDEHYLKDIFSRLLTKENFYGAAFELSVYAELLREGVDSNNITNSNKIIPDFKVTCNDVQVYIETKQLDVAQYDIETVDTERYIFNKIINYLNRNSYSLALGIIADHGCPSTVRKSLLERIIMLAQEVIQSPEKIHKCVYDKFEIIGERIDSSLQTPNMPSGYKVRLDVPLLRHGFNPPNHWMKAAYFFKDGDRTNFDFGFNIGFRRRRKIWSDKSLISNLKKARDQISSEGMGVIMIAIPSFILSNEDYDKQYIRAHNITNQWLQDANPDKILAVILVFDVIDYLRDLDDSSRIKYIRVCRFKHLIRGPQYNLAIRDNISLTHILGVLCKETHTLIDCIPSNGGRM